MLKKIAVSMQEDNLKVSLFEIETLIKECTDVTKI